MIAKLRPYPAYKDSGVEWLEKVPDHWEARKVKSLARPGYKTFVDGDWIESPYISSQGIRLIQTGNIGVGEYIEKGFRFITLETFQNFGCTEVAPDDVLICRLGDPVARACLAPPLPHRMITSVDVCILKPDEHASAHFLVYSMSCRHYLDWVRSRVRGSTRDRVSRSMLGSFSLPLPPVPEQTAIVRFLDHADRRIRRYIRAKKRLIELLEEQKRAIIHQAVTGQIDVRTGQPYPAYKDSRVEWLGMVPEHWDMGPLKRFVARSPSAIKAGPFGSQLTATEMTGKDYKVYTQRNVIGRDLKGGDRYISRRKFNDLRAFEVLPGDVLVTSRGTIGRTAMVDEGCEPGVLHPCLLRVRPDRNRLVGRLLMMLIQESQILPRQLAFLSNATTIDVIYSATLANIIVPVPPYQEQQRIVRHITERVGTIAVIRKEASTQIRLMGEYGTRLIADVVTGKLDVRNSVVYLREVDPIAGETRIGTIQAESNTHTIECGIAKEANP